MPLNEKRCKSTSVIRLGDFMHFGQLFKACWYNYFAQIANIFRQFLYRCQNLSFFYWNHFWVTFIDIWQLVTLKPTDQYLIARWQSVPFLCTRLFISSKKSEVSKSFPLNKVTALEINVLHLIFEPKSCLGQVKNLLYQKWLTNSVTRLDDLLHFG